MIGIADITAMWQMLDILCHGQITEFVSLSLKLIKCGKTGVFFKTKTMWISQLFTNVSNIMQFMTLNTNYYMHCARSCKCDTCMHATSFFFLFSWSFSYSWEKTFCSIATYRCESIVFYKMWEIFLVCTIYVTYCPTTKHRIQ